MKNEKLEQFRSFMKGKMAAVLGIGISNLPLIGFLTDCGAHVTVCDKKRKEELLDATLSYLKDLPVNYRLGEDYLDGLSEDIIFKTPGMRFDLPQLIQAREQGKIVTSEMEVFFELCPAPIIAVTGSDGKTTTTTLIYKMLTSQGYRCHLGGNIGKPLLAEVESIRPMDRVVLELSSFQLHTMKKSPHIAVVTNLSPNHLDMHKSMEEYVDAKKNIFRFQNREDRLVINGDNAITASFGGEAKSGVIYFGKTKGENEVYLKKDVLYYQDKPVLKREDIAVLGMHNVENYMAAIGAVGDIVTREVILEVAKTFTGVEHRIEFVREVGGVKYYNSSIDSSPNRTKNTLAVFDKKVIVILGGKDKGIPYDEIGPVLMEKAKAIVLIGATSDKIEKALLDAGGGDVPRKRCTTYEEAILAAASMAEEGDAVVLSPASTSFDMFRNFEERGNLFKKLVNQL